MHRALWITGAGWASGVIAAVVAVTIPGPETMTLALFSGATLGLVLHGTAICFAIHALLRKPGPNGPAVIGLFLGVVGLVAAFFFYSFWIAVASLGGA